jgi:uncharacterized protein
MQRLATCLHGLSAQGDIQAQTMENIKFYNNLDKDTQVQVGLKFGVDEKGNLCIDGTLRVRLHLVCQRCLEPMAFLIDSEVHLGIISSMAGDGGLCPGYSPLLLAQEPVSLLSIVEDELMLALPDVPKHRDPECAIASAYLATAHPREHPFAELLRSGNLKTS